MVQLLIERKARVNVADNRGDTALHIAMRARSKQIVEILLRNPKNSQLLYKPNKLNETPYNIDMSYNKTILGQIFGARKLNTNEDNENMLGYELYSAALADMLSEPSLSVPITVGLYARWGSGKSFLLNKLKEEMKNFARQWSETGWTWSWAVSWGAWHVALSAGACAALAGAPAYVATCVCFSLFASIYLALYVLWYLGNRYEWWWAGGVLSTLGRKFNSLLLVLQVVFCHPPGPNDPRALPATPIRFHFTEGMKSGGGQEGEAMVVQMIASLAEALECQYGRVCTRLARAFRPKPVSSTSGWRFHFTEGMKSGGGQEGDAMVLQMIASLAEALECQYGRVCTRLARAFRPKPVSSTSGWSVIYVWMEVRQHSLFIGVSVWTSLYEISTRLQTQTSVIYLWMEVLYTFHFTEGMKSGGGQEGEAMVVQMIASLAEALECQYGRVCTRLARAFRPKPVSSTSGWRFHFTGGMKSGGGQEGEAMVVQMIASLAEALECQYGRVCTRLARAFRPKPVSSTSGWRFHFTEGMKSGGGQEGEAMVVQMIASLAEALECQYGRVCTRLARAFRPKPVSSTSGWR
ncbi:KAP family p-loop domain-containing protein [Phthorimaea operculella]|nr:KAP family p-loop domain-containing protein [Phthorimaea operculella]